MSRPPTDNALQENTKKEIDALKEELAAIKEEFAALKKRIPRRISPNSVHKAAFNADLNGLKKHLKSLSPAARKRLLSEKSSVSIEHVETRYPNTTHADTPLQMTIFDNNEEIVVYLDSDKFRYPVTRTGTPLQMAIFDDDEEMAEYFQTQMDADEFHHQCREVFENAINGTTDAIKLALKDEIASLQKENITTADYFTLMREVQKKEAEVLCADSKKILTDANPSDFNINGMYHEHEDVRTTSTQVQGWVADFIKTILNYVKTHPIHNPYLLQTVFDIYAANVHEDDLDEYANTCGDYLTRAFSPQFCYFANKIIGGTQSFLSPRWLIHFTQNIHDLANNSVTPHRSFNCGKKYADHPLLDIRQLVASCIGENSFLEIYGKGESRGIFTHALLHAQALRNLCQTKTAGWNTLLRNQPEHAPDAATNGITPALQAHSIWGGRNNGSHQQEPLDVFLGIH